MSMGYCNEMDLLSASPIEIPQVCTIRPIFLSTFKGRGGAVRYQEYWQHLKLIATTAEALISSLVKVGVINEPLQEQIGTTTQFDILSSIFKEPFLEALSYFVEEDIAWDQRTTTFKCSDSDGSLVGEITKDTYQRVRKAIMESNCLALEEEKSEMKFANTKAKSIFEKLRAGRQKKKQIRSNNKEPSIEDIISSVSVRSNAYTLLNIWDLSIYQLYDQFARLSVNYELDVYSLRWAAWGTEPFDFTLWYKNNKEENKDG
jgi:hypothetical protein